MLTADNARVAGEFVSSAVGACSERGNVTCDDPTDVGKRQSREIASAQRLARD